jgi:hypothetical protein
MKGILTTTALASLILVAGVTISSPSAFAQDNQPCIGENCPAPDMQGEQGGKKRVKGVDQDSQGTEDESGQTPLRKKRIQGSTDEGDMQDGQKIRKKKVQQSKDAMSDRKRARAVAIGGSSPASIGAAKARARPTSTPMAAGGIPSPIGKCTPWVEAA